MAVIGAILGDIAGSQYEFHRPKRLAYKSCALFTDKCKFTDDTVMTLAVKKAIDEDLDLVQTMQEIGRKYPDSGYGGRFRHWVMGVNPKPYESYGNGSAMRVAYVGEHYDDLLDVISQAEKTAAVTHNHSEGIKGAVTTAVCIWMARMGKSKQEIYDYALQQYPAGSYAYSVDKDLDYLEKHYVWNETCMGSVPTAIRCFLDSDSFETFMRNIFRLKCDSDTLGAIGGAVAEEFYHGVGFDPKPGLRKYLDDRLWGILNLDGNLQGND